jgi:hypothetical protein
MGLRERQAACQSEDDHGRDERIETSEKQMKYKGQIAGFPQEVVERMLYEQQLQTGKRDVTVFEDYKTRCGPEGGFHWGSTDAGNNFWYEVIRCENFALFFERYPKTEPKPEPMTLTTKEKALVRMALGSMERRTLRQADKAKDNAREILTLVAQDFAALSERFNTEDK